MREMKDSGIEWIGEIPKHWKCCKQKYGLTLLNGRAFKESEFLEDGKYKVLRVGNLFTNPIWHYSNLMLEDNKYCQKGDLLYSWSMSYAPFIWSGDKVIYHYHIWKVLIDDILCKKFVYYYLLALTEALYAEIHETTMGFITMGIMNNSYLPYCNLEEQQQIANFLDTQCSKIDATTEDIQKKISLLEDYKKSVITEAVTKGLNPDAEMKDSGIEWIGEIPKDWTVKNLKYIFDITSGSTPASGVSQYWDGDIKWITPADFKTNDVYVFGGRRNITGLGLMSCSTQVIPDSSIIFSKRAPIGSVVITGEKMCINQGCLALISKHQKTSVKFYYYALSILDKIFDMLGNGTTFKEISAFRFSNTSLQCPRFEEQQQIADYLDTKCSEIDTFIADKKRQLDILADYKKSLIYEYVTGKKEVPVNDF